MRRTRWAAAVIVATVAVVAPVAAAVPAHAASDYRWWGYWFVNPGSSGWTYASIGAAGHRVDDGGVEGWRFAVAVPNPSAPPPRTSAATAFDSICGKTERPAGKDRVALVVDFGTTSDAPAGEHPPSSSVRGTCVVVPDRSNGLAVLSEAGYGIRQDGSGLICALQGYPRTECGQVVKPTRSPSTKPTPTPTKKGSARPTHSSSSGAPATSDAKPDRSTGQPTSSGSSPAKSPAQASSSAPSGSSPPTSTGGSDPTPSSTAVALEVGPPPDVPGGSGGASHGLVALLVGVLAVGGLAAAALMRGRGTRGSA